MQTTLALILEYADSSPTPETLYLVTLWLQTQTEVLRCLLRTAEFQSSELQHAARRRLHEELYQQDEKILFEYIELVEKSFLGHNSAVQLQSLRRSWEKLHVQRMRLLNVAHDHHRN